MGLDAVYGLGCKFTGCLEPEPMYLAKMWHLMKAHRKRTKITKIIPTWPSPQLAPPAPAPVALPPLPPPDSQPPSDPSIGTRFWNGVQWVTNGFKEPDVQNEGPIPPLPVQNTGKTPAWNSSTKINRPIG